MAIWCSSAVNRQESSASWMRLCWNRCFQTKNLQHTSKPFQYNNGQRLACKGENANVLPKGFFYFYEIYVDWRSAKCVSSDSYITVLITSCAKENIIQLKVFLRNVNDISGKNVIWSEKFLLHIYVATWWLIYFNDYIILFGLSINAYWKNIAKKEHLFKLTRAMVE